MKKSYLTLGALAMIMASCSNEVLIDNEDGQTDVAIGFSTFSDLATKADPTLNLEYYHKTFSVYGTKTSTINTTENAQYVFGADAVAATTVDGTVCTFVEEASTFYNSNWKYSPARYWDKQATYGFIAYAPAAAPIRYKYNTATSIVADAANDFVTTSVYELYGENVQDQTVQGSDTYALTSQKMAGFTASSSTDKEDIDIMISNPVTNQLGSDHIAATTQADKDVQLTFNHILAKLNVSFSKASSLDASVVTIKSVKIENLNNKGEYSRNKYLADGATTGWSSVGKTSGYTLSYNSDNASAKYKELPASTVTLNKRYFIESIVMPQTLDDATNLTVVYEIETVDPDDSTVKHTERFTYVADIQDVFSRFQDNYNYFVNFVISPTVITFDAGTAAWDTSIAADQLIK